MILVITPETGVPNEADIIHQMFREGLDLLHIRKPQMTEAEMSDFICRIDDIFYPQLVLHTHYDLGKEYNISRFHVREADRQQGKHRFIAKESIISTSVHHIAAYNSLEKEWEYAFISPFFTSISKKGYGTDTMLKEEIKNRNNPEVKLIALGGIGHDTIQNVFDRGVDGAALLGAVWESDQPLEAFKKCRKAILR
ncbi:thiamine phosphate synthase [Chryseobacterium pennipullorum]|uniref:Thiamine phosphate synthase n=1 Tax=Chryseobacterium pennipullorum TaxID=2258963 RepID=A0A3D9B3N7_9FLAO|nr:thiamine phosphate synthase [Chryseobacterium pennipullorum]REC48261.1 thiamine phosphate synthase [Chryseobacterium pennipullorum]